MQCLLLRLIVLIIDIGLSYCSVTAQTHESIPRYECTQFPAEEKHKNTIFWDMTPLSLVEFYRRFGGTGCLHLQSRRISHVSSRESLNYLSSSSTHRGKQFRILSYLKPTFQLKFASELWDAFQLQAFPFCICSKICYCRLDLLVSYSWYQYIRFGF
jgi:hypothetical protein